VGINLSKKKRQKDAIKKEHQRQQQRRAKQNRQKNDPAKWEEKKAKKKAAQQNKWDSQYHGVNPDCKLNLSTFPSPQNCSGCNLHCKYNQN